MPPVIAPSRLKDMALDGPPCFLRRTENIIPPENTGQVNNTTAVSFPENVAVGDPLHGTQ